MNSGTTAGLISAPLKTKGFNFSNNNFISNSQFSITAGILKGGSIKIKAGTPIFGVGYTTPAGASLSINGANGNVNGGGNISGGSIYIKSGSSSTSSGGNINFTTYGGSNLTGGILFVTSTINNGVSAGNIKLTTSTATSPGEILFAPNTLLTSPALIRVSSIAGKVALLNYNTYTNSSNYERSFMGFDATQFYIDVQKLGTGVGRTFSIRRGGSRVAYGASDDYGLGFGSGTGGYRSVYLGKSTAAGYSLAMGWSGAASVGFSNTLGAFLTSDISGRTSMCPGQGPIPASNLRSGLQGLTALTSDATVKPLAFPNYGLLTHVGCVLSLNSSISIIGTVVAKGGGFTASFFVQASFQNSNGTMSIVGTPIITQMSNNSNAWSIAAAVDNTNKIWQLNVTGAIATSISWSAMLIVDQIKL